MNAIQPKARKADLTVIHVLAELLERLEMSTVPVDAEQYRSVVKRLIGEFGNVEPGKALGALLDDYRAAAELYENVNYQHAGLCRSALEVSLDSEQQATEIVERAMHRPMNQLPRSPNQEDPTHGKS